MPADFGQLAIIGAIYSLGIVFFLAKIPERWLKGQVDYIGSSHNIFHVIVLFGIAIDFKYGF
jgi:adiponectin receptor